MSRQIHELSAIVDSNISGFESGLRKVAQTAGKVADAWGRAASDVANAATRIGAAVAGMGAVVGKAFASFEATMLRAGAITETLGTRDFKALEAAAKRMGQTTIFSSQQAAEAVEVLGQAGLSTTEIMAALPQAMQLAAASSVDIETAAEVAAKTMRAFGMDAEQLSHINDVYTLTAVRSTTSIRDLAEAMKHVAPVSKALGVSIEDTAAVLGKLGDQGFNGSIAGTALRNILSRLAGAVPEALSKLEALGVTTLDTTGKMRPFLDIMEDIERQAISEAEVLQIFGSRGGPQMLSLLEVGSGALRSFSAEMAESGGTAKRLSDVQLEGLSGKFLLLRKQFESIALEAGQQLAPTFHSLIQRVRDFIDANRPQIIERMTAAIGSLSEMGERLVAWLQDSGPGLMKVADGFQSVFQWTTKLLADNPKLATFFGMFKAGQLLGINQAFVSLAQAIGVTVQAIAGLGNSRLASILMTDVSTPVLNAARNIKDAFVGSWRAAQEAANTAANKMAEAGALIISPMRTVDMVFRQAATSAESFAAALTGKVDPAAIAASAAVARITQQVALLGVEFTALIGPVSNALTVISAGMHRLGVSMAMPMQQVSQFGRLLLTGPADAFARTAQAATVIDATFTRVGASASATGQKVAGMASVFSQWASNMTGQVAAALSAVGSGFTMLTQKAWASVTAANALKVGLAALRIAINLGPMIAMELMMRKLSELTRELNAQLLKLSHSFQDQMDGITRRQQTFMRDVPRFWQDPILQAQAYRQELERVNKETQIMEGRVRGAQRTVDEIQGANPNDEHAADAERAVLNEERTRLKNLQGFKAQLEDAALAAEDQGGIKNPADKARAAEFLGKGAGALPEKAGAAVGDNAAGAMQQQAPAVGRAIGEAAAAAMGGQAGGGGGGGKGEGGKKGPTIAEQIQAAQDDAIESKNRGFGNLFDFISQPGVTGKNAEDFLRAHEGANPGMVKQFGADVTAAGGDEMQLRAIAADFARMLNDAIRNEKAAEQVGDFRSAAEKTNGQFGVQAGATGGLLHGVQQAQAGMAAGTVSPEQFATVLSDAKQKLSELASEAQRSRDATAGLNTTLQQYEQSGHLSKEATQQLTTEMTESKAALDAGKISQDQYQQKLREIAQTASQVAAASPAAAMADFEQKLKVLTLSGRMSATAADGLRAEMQKLHAEFLKTGNVEKFTQALRDLLDTAGSAPSGGFGGGGMFGGMFGGFQPQNIGTPGEWFSKAADATSKMFGGGGGGGGGFGPAPPPTPTPIEQIASSAAGRLSASEPFKESLEALQSSLASDMSAKVGRLQARISTMPPDDFSSDLMGGSMKGLNSPMKKPGQIDARNVTLEFPSMTKLTVNDIEQIMDAIRREEERAGRSF